MDPKIEPVPLGEPLSARDGYAAWASVYDEDGNPLIALEEPIMRAWMAPEPGLRALDLGCGTGRLSLALAEGGARVVAADLSLEMLAKAAAKLAQRDPGRRVKLVRVALPGPLPFLDGSFALVVMGLVAEHIADLDLLMAATARLLTPGGRLLLSALHPDRTAQGQTARFIDPETGLRRPVETYHRPVATYLTAAARVGLALTQEATPVVTAELADRLPRARRYVDQALGWVAEWRLGPA